MALEVTGLARLQARSVIKELNSDFCYKFYQAEAGDPAGRFAINAFRDKIYGNNDAER